MSVFSKELVLSSCKGCRRLIKKGYTQRGFFLGILTLLLYNIYTLRLYVHLNYLTTSPFSEHSKFDCTIDTKSLEPTPLKKNRPLSIPEREALQNYLDDLIVRQFIRESTSPHTSNIIIVKQKKNYRICVDYRNLNSQLRVEQYLMLLISDIHLCLHSFTTFSKIDLTYAF
jgi:hypothetical protein